MHASQLPSFLSSSELRFQMPGTIQVSVVELMDVPKAEANTNSFILKVAMGKREYQSMGQCDCSVPLVSLRENLIVVIHDLDGNKILQTEFRTISVVEKGLVEDSYPLESGGYVQMKLQFSLSQEEHMRIREKRESALKRKREEQMHSEAKSSLSGMTDGNLNTNLISEGAIFYESNQKDTDSHISLGLPALPQDSVQLSELLGESDGCQVIETNKEDLKMQPSLDFINKSQISSEVVSHPQSETESLVSGNVSEYRSSALKENQNRRSNVKKMITAFESSVSQAPDPHFSLKIKPSLRKIEMEYSLKEVPLQESYANVPQHPPVMLKSFSSGMISDTSSQRNPIRSVFLKKRENAEETKGGVKDSMQSENIEKLNSRESIDPQAVNETIRNEDVKEDGPVSVSKKDPITMLSKINSKEATYISNAASDAISLSYNDKEMKVITKNVMLETVQVKKKAKEQEIQLSRINKSDTLSLHQLGSVPILPARIDKSDTTPISILDEPARIDMSDTTTIYQQGSTPISILRGSGRIHSNEEIACAFPNGTVRLSSHSYNNGCHCGDHDVWSARRLCITTGSPQLGALVECCCTNQAEENPSILSGDQKVDDENIEKGENSYKCFRSSSNAGWIEQGARIATILVACGLLLLNSRQRNPN